LGESFWNMERFSHIAAFQSINQKQVR